MRRISFYVLVLLNPPKNKDFQQKKLKDFPPKKLKTQAKSRKNSSSNSQKTQKPATPVELNCRKSVQKISLPIWSSFSQMRDIVTLNVIEFENCKKKFLVSRNLYLWLRVRAEATTLHLRASRADCATYQRMFCVAHLRLVILLPLVRLT